MNYAELKGTRREWNNMGNEAIFGRYIKEWIDNKSSVIIDWSLTGWVCPWETLLWSHENPGRFARGKGPGCNGKDPSRKGVSVILYRYCTLGPWAYWHADFHLDSSASFTKDDSRAHRQEPWSGTRPDRTTLVLSSSSFLFLHFPFFSSS